MNASRKKSHLVAGDFLLLKKVVTSIFLHPIYKKLLI